MARDSEKTEKGDTAAKDVRLTEHSVCVCVCVWRQTDAEPSWSTEIYQKPWNLELCVQTTL